MVGANNLSKMVLDKWMSFDMLIKESIRSLNVLPNVPVTLTALLFPSEQVLVKDVLDSLRDATS